MGMGLRKDLEGSNRNSSVRRRPTPSSSSPNPQSSFLRSANQHGRSFPSTAVVAVRLGGQISVSCS
ncbi:hypothetical protein MUK42_37613 [Musa troglodytarum]|uniref:Uncharacterized protein n=1 Tax=Musa troglodytarum TaxID=320322 RepID=A0A9E7JYC7_9LILI|nr:hypothetical protein MUK42_37613 [Musa troglodytarum]